MKQFLFVFFSTIDFLSLVLFGLTVFRNRIQKHKINKIVLMSLTLAILSLMLNLFSLNAISPIVQFVVLVFIYVFTMKERMLYSLAIVGTAYVLYGLIQTGLILILDYYKVILYSELVPFTFKGYCLQFSTSFILLIATIYLRKFGGGFSFVPHEPTKNSKYRYSNKILGFTISISLAILFGLYYEYNTIHSVYIMVLIFVAIAIVYGIIFYLSLLRDVEDAKTGEEVKRK